MPRKKKTKADPVSALRHAIETGQLLPSQRLVEADLAEQFGTNRANIKLALGKLEQEGLVTSEPNRGARVRVITMREAYEILDVRILLESLMARRAAFNATPEDCAHLREILERLTTAIRNQALTEYSAQNGVLHATIRSISKHFTASRLVSSLNAQIVRFQFRTIFFPGRIESSVREHTEIVEAICANDEDRAERAMRTHINGVVDIFRKINSMEETLSTSLPPEK